MDWSATRFQEYMIEDNTCLFDEKSSENPYSINREKLIFFRSDSRQIVTFDEIKNKVKVVSFCFVDAHIDNIDLQKPNFEFFDSINTDKILYKNIDRNSFYLINYKQYSNK